MEFVGRGYGVLKVIEPGTACYLEADHTADVLVKDCIGARALPDSRWVRAWPCRYLFQRPNDLFSSGALPPCPPPPPGGSSSSP